MAVALISDTDTKTTGGANTLCIAVPGCTVAGSILVTIEFNGNATNNPNFDLFCCWTRLSFCSIGTQKFNIWWRLATNCEPCCYTLRMGGGESEDNWNIWMGAFSGADPCGPIVTPQPMVQRCTCPCDDCVITPPTEIVAYCGDHYAISHWATHATFGDAITSITRPVGCDCLIVSEAIGQFTDTVLAISGRQLCCATSDPCCRTWVVLAGNDIFKRLGRIIIPAVRTGCGCGKKVPTFKTSACNKGSSTCLVVNKPAGLKKNELVIVVIGRKDTAGAITCVPAGFTLVHSSDGCIANVGDLDIYAKQAGNGEPASYTFVSASSDAFIAHSMRIRNACTSCFSVSCNLEGTNNQFNPGPVLLTCGEFSNWLSVVTVVTNTSLAALISNNYTTVETCSSSQLRLSTGIQELDNKDYSYGGTLNSGSTIAEINSVNVLVHPKVPRPKKICCEEGCDVGSLTFTIPCCVLPCDLMFIMIQRCTDAGTLTWPCGWASFFSEDTANVDLDLGFHVIASSCEACDAVVVCFATCDNATGHQYQMRGVNVGSAPEVSSTAATGSSVNPNPPSLTVCANDTYVAVTFIGGSGDITEPVCAVPCGHTLGATVEVAGGCFWWSASSYSTNPFTGVTNDPGTYTLNTSRPWAAVTVFVRAERFNLGLAAPANNNVGGWMNIIGKPGGV